jgi:DNA-binding response OmpR family regulator
MADKILLVDDDRDICEIVAFNLKNEGFDVEFVYSAEEALAKSPDDFSLILLDVMMGGMSGYKMAENLRMKKIRTPVIFLTAKDTENDMLTGFSVGGDDYISKPFSIKEVVARIKAVLKRTNAPPAKDPPEENVLAFGRLVIILDVKELIIDGKKTPLTKTEFELLVLLAANPNRIFSRKEVISRLWEKTPFITERTVDVHITRLRQKMGRYASVITNRSGYGYRFDMSDL